MKAKNANKNKSANTNVNIKDVKGVKMKRRLSEQQEFEIMKLVLDKFLWLGFGIMAYGLYVMYAAEAITGLVWIIAGAVILLIFTWIITKEYEIIR